MREYSIAAIPADGIGPEVIGAGLEVLEPLEAAGRSCGFDIRTLRLGLGLLPQAWRDDAGRRAGLAARHSTRSISARSGRPEHSRPHLALGPAAADLPGLRPIRQCPAHPHPARRHLAAARRRPRRSGLGDRARKLAKANMPARAGAPIAACPRKSPPRPRSSPAAASSGSCASPSRSPGAGRASI